MMTPAGWGKAAAASTTRTRSIAERDGVYATHLHRLRSLSPTNGTLYVTIGVWGTWETARTYVVDDVTIRFTPITQ